MSEHTQRIEAEGEAAFKAGQKDNPYPKAFDENALWQVGYDRAKKAKADGNKG